MTEESGQNKPNWIHLDTMKLQKAGSRYTLTVPKVAVRNLDLEKGDSLEVHFDVETKNLIYSIAADTDED